MSIIFSKKWLIVIVFCWFFQCFWQLGTPAFFQGDEGTYAEIAREILVHRDAVTLHLNDHVRMEKPPLYFWLTSLNYLMFGYSEWSVRLWASLFSLLSSLSIFLMMRSRGEPLAGLSALIFLSLIQTVVQSRVAALDSMLSFFLLIASGMVWRWIETQQRSYLMLASVLFGFATLAKGPIGLVIPLLVLPITLLWHWWVQPACSFFTRKFWSFLLDFFLAFFVFCLVSLPWYISAFYANGMAFVHEFIGYHNVLRYTQAIEQHGAPFYFYFGVVLLGFFPWSSFLISAFLHPIPWRQISFRYRYMVVWVLVFFIFFSLGQSKLPGYIFPLYSMLAILLASVLYRYPWKRWWFFFGAYGSVVLVGLWILVLALSFYFYPPSETAIDPVSLLVLAVPWMLVLPVLLIGSIKRLQWWGFFALIAGSMGMSLVMVHVVLPPMEKDKDIVRMAHFVAKNYPAVPYAVYQTIDTRFLFYTRSFAQQIDDPSSLFAWTHANSNGVVVMHVRDAEPFSSQYPGRLRLIYRDGNFLLFRLNQNE